MKLVTKGTWYYEIQILMFVIMWKHNKEHRPQNHPIKGHFVLGNLVIWRDTAWLYHGFGLELNRTWRFVTESIRRWWFHIVLRYRLRSKWLSLIIFMKSIDLINLKQRIAFLTMIVSIYEFERTVRHLVHLYRSGLRVSNPIDSKVEDFSVYRFTWKNQPIDGFPDIVRTAGKFYSVINGRWYRQP